MMTGRNCKFLALSLGVGLTLCGGFAASCDSGPEITGTGTNFGGVKKDKEKAKEGGGLFDDDEEGGSLFDEDGNLRDGKLGGDLDSATGGSSQINYPVMDLTGHGNVTCDGDVYGVLGQYTNTIDSEKVDLNFYNGSISGAGKGEDKANQKIREKLGETIYTRITKTERAEWLKKSYDLQPFAIFAKSAAKTKAGTVFNFSQPLPVFPMPAAPVRYAELQKGPKTWTAEVTGSASFTVQMTMSITSLSEDAVVLSIDTFIPQDTDRSLYDLWPLAKQAIYTMSPKALEVRSIQATNWFNDRSNCSGPEALNITFRLCKKTVGGQSKDYPCQ